ncbi:Uncharacterised protein [Kingella potus]|uniref:Uncharacterized protein n=1 Tax=Kingella potus TaxID=265175 RepID=A0A377R0W6_9NEIS|nr:Uncharacterised protein [Kingella potus]
MCGAATHAFPIFRKDADCGCKRFVRHPSNSLPRRRRRKQRPSENPYCVVSDSLLHTKTACVAWSDTPYAVRRGKTDRPSEKRIVLFQTAFAAKVGCVTQPRTRSQYFGKMQDAAANTNPTPDQTPSPAPARGRAGEGVAVCKTAFPPANAAGAAKPPHPNPPPQAGEGTEAV